MKIIINNKTFLGRLENFGKLKIKLFKAADVLFFNEWQETAFDKKTRIQNYKKDYVKDIEYFTILKKGILKNCFPTLSINEDSVIIHYDYIING